MLRCPFVSFEKARSRIYTLVWFWYLFLFTFVCATDISASAISSDPILEKKAVFGINSRWLRIRCTRRKYSYCIHHCNELLLSKENCRVFISHKIIGVVPLKLFQLSLKYRLDYFLKMAKTIQLIIPL